MVVVQDLKNVPLFRDADEGILEEILPLIRLETFQEGEVIYEENSVAENFYILRAGKALLEADLTPDISVSLASIKPGYVFGLYSLIPNSVHSMRAICSEESDVLTIPGEDLRKVLQDNHAFGYEFMSALFMLLKIRLDRRTSQFIRVLQRHPDLNIPLEE
ncbi:MAG: Crp/Fnr family transcriptional regulator [Desulfovibrionales bacterium]